MADRPEFTTTPPALRSVRRGPSPTEPGERILSLDILRGVPLLGIFSINIRYVSMPMGELSNPSFAADGLQSGHFWAGLRTGHGLYEDLYPD